MYFAFGPYELRLGTCELQREGLNVRLQPRVFGVLRYLIEHRDRVVTKQELIDALWGGYQLNAIAVPWTINRARKALGDQPNGSEFIETVRGHGYRFVAAVIAHTDDTPVPAQPQAHVNDQAPLLQSMERPFVGRAAIMLQLTASLDVAAAGHGKLWLLTGEPGIGKTRCTDEFAQIVRRRGLQVWVGRCFQHGVAPAFWPFVQVLRAACADPSLHESVRSDGEALLRELGPRQGDDFQPAQVRRPDGEQFWLLDRLSRWFCRSARSQVRVIELDDIHCADDSSLQALALLAPMLASARLLVIASARDSGVPAGRSASALAALVHPCEPLPLLGLGREDIEAYLRVVLGEQAATRMGSALTLRTAGNPLFLNEVLRVLTTRYARDQKVRIEDVPLPAAVSDIISARLRELDPGARELLDTACVLGDELALPVLQRASGLHAKQLLEHLQTAALANIVEPRPDSKVGTRYGFVHPLMREVLYAALSTIRRAELHAAVGLAIEALGVVEPHLQELAYHFHHAPLEAYYERAARYGRLAGEAALSSLAYEEAVQSYAWALAAQAQYAADDMRAKCELLIASACALFLAGRGLEGRKYCQRAIELASQHKLPELLVRAARQLRPSVWLAQIPDPIAVPALEEALRLLPESAMEQRALAYAQLSVFPPYSLRITSCLQMSGEALRLARIANDPKVILNAQVSRLFSLCGATTITEQLEVADDILRHDTARYWRWATDAHLARYHAFMQRGDAQSAEQALDAFSQSASDLRLPFMMWHAERLRAQRLLYTGRLDEAERRFDELWNESQRMKLPLGLYYRIVHSHMISLERTGKRQQRSIHDLPDATSWVQAMPSYRAISISKALEAGETSRAAKEFRSLAENDFAAASDDVFALAVLVRLASSAVALGEREAATALRDLLAPHAALFAISNLTHSLGSVSRYLGELAQFLGQPQQARAHFEHAIKANARVGHELERLRSALGLARLLALGRASERVQARKLAEGVATTARQIGAQALAEQAQKLYPLALAAQVPVEPRARTKPTRASGPTRARVSKARSDAKPSR